MNQPMPACPCCHLWVLELAESRGVWRTRSFSALFRYLLFYSSSRNCHFLVGANTLQWDLQRMHSSVAQPCQMRVGPSFRTPVNHAYSIRDSTRSRKRDLVQAQPKLYVGDGKVTRDDENDVCTIHAVPTFTTLVGAKPAKSPRKGFVSLAVRLKWSVWCIYILCSKKSSLH